MIAGDRHDLLSTWALPWDVMDVLVSGRSSIDMAAVPVRDFDDATQFVRAYGYDSDRPTDRRLMHAILVESLHFIEANLMPDEWRKGLTPPPEILQCSDPRQLLLYTAEETKGNEMRQAWACAVLRVAHTIAHIEGVMRSADLEAARKQISERFQSYIRRSPDGQQLFGSDAVSVPLVKVDWKVGKSRESTILKLLHKRANVAETIYDRLGVRIVTHTVADAVLAAHILQREYMVTFANCVPSRARNSLVDFEEFKRKIQTLLGALKEQRMTADEFRSEMAELDAPISGVEHTNPHTSLAYQAIQFTCRQMIRWPNPMFGWVAKIKQVAHLPTSGLSASERVTLTKVADAICGWTGVEENLKQEAFFPFEIQIMDKRAFLKNQFGDAAHDRYKRSQARTARKRVLARVLELAKI